MISTRVDKLDNKITDAWIAQVCGSIYDRLTGVEPTGDEDAGMVAVALTLHQMDMQSEEAPVPMLVSDLVGKVYSVYNSVNEIEPAAAAEQLAHPAVRMAWETIVRWTMYALQCDGEPDAREAAELFIKRALEKTDVDHPGRTAGPSTTGTAAEAEGDELPPEPAGYGGLAVGRVTGG